MRNSVGCNVSFSHLDACQVDACENRLQLGWFDDDVLAIGRA